MSEVIKVRIKPIKELWYGEENNNGGYSCETDERDKVKLNSYENFVIKGTTVKLTIGSEYNAKLEESYDKKRGTYYIIHGIYQDMPTDRNKQKSYLKTILTDNQVENIFNSYPEGNIIELIKEAKVDYKKIHGVGIKSLNKIRDKIIENFEFQEAFDFLSQYGIKDTLIVKLVKHFKSAGLLIKKVKENPYSVTEVNGVGFKKADQIALAIGYDPHSKNRIQAAVEFIVEEEANNGNTYIVIDKLIEEVAVLINIEDNLIEIRETDKLFIHEDKVALVNLYKAEKYIAKRVTSLLQNKDELDFDVDKFITKQENKHGLNLTDQQKNFFNNIKSNKFNVLSGFAGCGKSMLQKLLIELLDELKVTYRLLAPTGKAAKVLSKYTNRNVETIHRAIGLGKERDQEAQTTIEEEFVIVDETSMKDVALCAKLLNKCNNKRLRMLFIGDPAQIPSVSAGNVLHDLISSGIVPVTEVNIVFRQSEGGILDVATKVRQGQKFIDNNAFGIHKYGSNCVVVCVPKEKIETGYRYYFKQFIDKYNADDITIVTPTKKSTLGTVEINKQIQDIVNPKSNNKNEIEYGYDKVIFREGDYVINTSNTYKVEDTWGIKQDIVNGDMGIIEKIDAEEGITVVNFGLFKIPFETKDLKQLLHAWCLTKHKMQGSAAKVIIAIADKSHKFQLTANLLYTAFTRPEEQLVILSQGDTINYALRNFANLKRNTFLKSMLRGEYKQK